MEIVVTLDQMRFWHESWRRVGKTVALVPTMGALHAGHLALVAKAAEIADKVVVSIFVNPLQFGPSEDFSRYPRDLTLDLEKLAHLGKADLIFNPSVEVMYPGGTSLTTVVVGEMSQVLCGRSRPTHFAGVTTVVTKLLHIVQPDVAVFGQKDAQQLAIIRQMVHDLNFPVKVVGVATVREPSGLALSSRNRYLSPEEKEKASYLYQGLKAAETLFQRGERRAEVLVAWVKNTLAEADLSAEYVECVDFESLRPVEIIERPVTLALAAYVGTARLIDNITLDPGH
ncbi:MAG: pantoate--beta-alanine ligase [Sulfobacillus benefaciens]|uniref:Pantothenate synthetase n=1 Tax=Sulfobacillus benefaciens TaxID=453960 RepID=A0A2T2XG81_9FIRM|nr:MAG: pantoate--beta-alanine ligase [Sulfobacillus benefaciens]